MNVMLQMTGIHCNSDKNPVKLSILDFSTNIELLWETDPSRFLKGDVLTICDVHPNKCGEERSCYYFMRELDSGGYGMCNETTPAPDCKYYLNDGVCHNCTDQEICIQENEFWIFCGTWYDICLDDAYYGGGQVTDFMTKCRTTCDVPKYYMWNQTSGKYHCLVPDKCGNSATQEISAIDEKLDRAGAELLYTDNDERGFTRVVGISCDANLNPKLTFFGINIFDYKIWVILFIIAVMFIFLNKVKRH